MDDKKGIGASHNNLGLLEFHRGNYQNAIDHFLVTLKIYENITDNMGSITHRKAIAQASNNLALVHHEQHNYDKAMDYFNRSLEIRKEINDIREMADSYNNLNGLYMKSGKEMCCIFFQTVMQVHSEGRTGKNSSMPS